MKEQLKQGFARLSEEIQIGPNPTLDSLLEKYGPYSQETLLKARVLGLSKLEEEKSKLRFARNNTDIVVLEEKISLLKKKNMIIEYLIASCKNKDKENRGIVEIYVEQVLKEYGIYSDNLVAELSTNLRMYSNKQVRSIKEGVFVKPVTSTPIANLLHKLMCKARKYKV